MEEIRSDMVVYEDTFHVNIIPHISENKDIVDNIHNYMNRAASKDAKQDTFNQTGTTSKDL